MKRRSSSMLYAAENANPTVMAGFTTVQSPGLEISKDLRDWIATGPLSGPRILTSLGVIPEGTPDEIRPEVRKFVADGADVIKIFAPPRAIGRGRADSFGRTA